MANPSRRRRCQRSGLRCVSWYRQRVLGLRFCKSFPTTRRWREGTIAVSTASLPGFTTVTVSTYGQVAIAAVCVHGFADRSHAQRGDSQPGGAGRADRHQPNLLDRLPYCTIRLIGQYSHFSAPSTATFGAGITVQSVPSQPHRSGRGHHHRSALLPRRTPEITWSAAWPGPKRSTATSTISSSARARPAVVLANRLSADPRNARAAARSRRPRQLDLVSYSGRLSVRHGQSALRLALQDRA